MTDFVVHGHIFVVLLVFIKKKLELRNTFKTRHKRNQMFLRR